VMRMLVFLIVLFYPTVFQTVPPLWAESEGQSSDFYWYKTQFGTGGTGNCGPACAAMAIHWATGRDISVRKIRDEIGEPNGSRATSLALQKWIIEKHGVKAEYIWPNSAAQLLTVVKRGNIALLWIHTGKISMSKGDVTKTRKGRYYPDECGHYIVLKGLTSDGDYFIVHDPAPGDWATNTVRYPDGGRLGVNRYFAVSEVWESLMERKVIEVYKNNR
jgi:hypothetical protein